MQRLDLLPKRQLFISYTPKGTFTQLLATPQMSLTALMLCVCACVLVGDLGETGEGLTCLPISTVRWSLRAVSYAAGSHGRAPLHAAVSNRTERFDHLTEIQISLNKQYILL